MKKYFNKIIIFGIICITTLFINSCTKLKDTSYSSIVASQFVPSSADIGSLIGSAYGSWRDVLWAGGRGLWTAQEETADALVRARKPYGFFDGGIHQRLHFHDWTNEDGCFGNVWGSAYAGVTNCNRILFQIESGDIPIAAADKAAVIGEIKVLRASFYYVLCDVFGNVPIVTKFDVVPGFLPTQSTRKEVYNFIVAEIVASIPALSDDRSIKTYGRFNNKWSANALLAKVYLNAAVYTGAPYVAGQPAVLGTPEWEKCLQACDAIINSGKGFALEPVQKNVFKEQNQNSKEHVWAVPFDQAFGLWCPLMIITLPGQAQTTFNTTSTGWGGLVSIPQFISTYNPQDKRLTDGWLQGQVNSSAGVPQTVNTGALKGQLMNIVNELPGIDSSEEIHSFRLLKYEVPAGSDPSNMNHDAPVIRYADILMMKAECLLRLGRPGAGALVTEVRSRNFTANPALATVTDAQLAQTSSYDYGLRDFRAGTTHETANIPFGRMLDELGWEFVGEGHRRPDMIRFGVFNTRSFLSRLGKVNGAEDYRNIAPIPRAVLNSNTNLKQNAGY